MKTGRRYASYRNGGDRECVLQNLIISVETAVMHLANAVHVPVIALMRQTNPEWTPIDGNNSVVLTVATRKGHLDDIAIRDVLSVLDTWKPERRLPSGLHQTREQAAP